MGEEFKGARSLSVSAERLSTVPKKLPGLNISFVLSRSNEVVF